MVALIAVIARIITQHRLCTAARYLRWTSDAGKRREYCSVVSSRVVAE